MVFLDLLSQLLADNFRYRIDGYKANYRYQDGTPVIFKNTSDNGAVVKLFNSHSTYRGEGVIRPVEYHTSAIVFDVVKEDDTDGKEAANMILFRLSTDPSVTQPDKIIKELDWRGNCTFGALVSDDDIQWFKSDIGAKLWRIIPDISEVIDYTLISELYTELDTFLTSRAKAKE